LDEEPASIVPNLRERLTKQEKERKQLRAQPEFLGVSEMPFAGSASCRIMERSHNAKISGVTGCEFLRSEIGELVSCPTEKIGISEGEAHAEPN